MLPDPVGYINLSDRVGRQGEVTFVGQQFKRLSETDFEYDPERIQGSHARVKEFANSRRKVHSIQNRHPFSEDARDTLKNFPIQQRSRTVVALDDDDGMLS